MATIEINSSIERALAELKATPSERKLYVALLNLQDVSISKTAKLLKMKRPYIYALLKSMRGRGLLDQKEDGSNTDFKIISPEVILQRLREKEESITSTRKALEKDVGRYVSAHKSKVSSLDWYEGEREVFELVKNIIRRAKGNVLYYGDPAMLEKMKENQKICEICLRRVESKEMNLSLLLTHLGGVHVKDVGGCFEKGHVRILPKNDSGEIKSSFGVFNESVFFWRNNEPVACLINSSQLASLFRSIFATVHGISKKL